MAEPADPDEYPARGVLENTVMGAIETLFEERGWEDAVYPGDGYPFYPWGKDGLGLLIRPEEDSRFWTALAGDALAGKRLIRITSFEAAVVAIDFCDRIAPLADWRKASGWTAEAPPAGARELGEKVHAIAVEVSTPDPKATAAELRRRAASLLAHADELRGCIAGHEGDGFRGITE